MSAENAAEEPHPYSEHHQPTKFDLVAAITKMSPDDPHAVRAAKIVAEAIGAYATPSTLLMHSAHLRDNFVATKAIAALQKRIDALEQHRTMRFEGPHDPAKAYRPGAVVQRSGSTYVALTETDEPPGQSSLWRRLGNDR